MSLDCAHQKAAEPGFESSRLTVQEWGNPATMATDELWTGRGDVLQLAASLGCDAARFGIIGLSGGAPYAAACAQQIPHRLSHVAIVSGHAPMNAAGTCPGDQDKLIKLVSRRPRLGQLAFGVIDRRLDRRPDRVVRSLLKNWTAEDRQLLLGDQQLYQQLVLNLSEATRRGSAGIVKDVHLLGRRWGFCLSQIQGVGVSIWQGGCDRTVTPSMARYFQRQISGSELIVDLTCQSAMSP